MLWTPSSKAGIFFAAITQKVRNITMHIIMLVAIITAAAATIFQYHYFLYLMLLPLLFHLNLSKFLLTNEKYYASERYRKFHIFAWHYRQDLMSFLIQCLCSLLYID